MLREETIQVVKPVGVHTRPKIALNWVTMVFAENVAIQTTDEINVRI